VPAPDVGAPRASEDVAPPAAVDAPVVAAATAAPDAAEDEAPDAATVPAEPTALAPADAGAAPTAPANVAPERGLLTLDTEPWTRVYLGKTLLGDTPLVDVRVPAGRQRLRLVNPSEQVDTEIEVQVPAGGRVRKKLAL
jgi:serine/threonine-protein kinase